MSKDAEQLDWCRVADLDELPAGGVKTVTARYMGDFNKKVKYKMDITNALPTTRNSSRPPRSSVPALVEIITVPELI